MKKPVRIGIIGMGGFAGSHHGAVAKLEERGHARLVCTCDPHPDRFEAMREGLRFVQRGVSVLSDYRAMLEVHAADLDLVVVPTPIHLHAEMHDAATACGLPAYLEKPPTLDHAELERMVSADARVRKASLVGFNFIVEKPRLALKRRILDGDFGAVREATLCALWPRPASYFSRNAWAGRLALDGRLVLDSCFGNAMAHFVHNLLFWTGGPDLFHWAEIAAVKAELYRGHAIEGADTFFVRAETGAGATLRFALSHACAGPSAHVETVRCERAAIQYVVGRGAEIRWNDGRTERQPLEPFDGLAENYLEYSRYLRGESERPATMLPDCRPLVILNDLAYISSRRIAPIPANRLSRVRDEKEQKDYLQVCGLTAAVDRFLTGGVWPGSGEWDHAPAAAATPDDLPRLAEIVARMRESG